MPTGYTHAVQDGTMTEFRDFALTCARAFGACIMMRDDPAGPAPREMPPRSTFYDEYLERANTRLNELVDMSPTDIEAACVRDHAERLSSWRQRRLERNRSRENYLAMLAHVEKWTPPTPDHVELKSFMAKQLHESINWDCSGSYDTEPQAIAASEWYSQQLESAKKDVLRYTDELAKEIARHAERNKWIADLYDSLPAEGGPHDPQRMR